MVYKFEQIAYNITAKRSPNKDDMSSYIGLEHLESGSLDVTSFGSKVEIKGDKLIMAKGDVLLGKRNAYLRRAAIAPHDGLFSAHGMILRPKEDVIDPKYFPFFIASDIFFDEAIRISVGGLSPTINWKDLKELEFTLPSLSEQKVLADKLWAAYRVKESYKKLLAATNDMLKAKFATLVLNKEWPTEKLSKIATYSIGLTYKPSEVAENGIIVLRSGNIQDSHIILEDVVRVTTKIKDNLYVQKDDILMCSRNGSAQLVGKVALIPELIEPMTFGAFMTIIRSKYSRYLLLYFQTKEFRKQLSGSKSSVMNQVTQKMLDEIIIPIPDTKTIDELVNIATQAEATKESLRKSIENIDQVIKSLINQ